MYMTLREYRVDSKQADEVIRRVDLGWLDKIRQVRGFLSYHVVRPAEDRLVSVATFIDEAAAKRGAEASAEWVGERLGDLEVEFLDMREGPVVIHAG